MADEGWSIEWYRTPRGESPARTFLDGLDSPHKDEAAALLRIARARGYTLREPHSKNLGDRLLEPRSRHGVRLFYTIRRRRIVVLDGIVKKQDAIPPAVLDRVRMYLAAVERAEAKRGRGA
jgi:hypothetical protein